MEIHTLKAQLRHSKGKGTARALRRDGNIPAVLYGADIESIPLSLSIYDVEQLLKKVNYAQALLNLVVENDQPFEKTHDIEILVSLANRYEAGYADWFEAATNLTPYATTFRYPSALLEPTREEFREALVAAGGLVAFTLSVLPKEARPEDTEDSWPLYALYAT